MYFTDRGIEELVERRGDETVTLEWVGDRLRDFVDAQPGVRDPDRALRHLAGPPDDDDDEDVTPSALIDLGHDGGRLTHS